MNFSVAAVELNQLTFITESPASYNYIRDGKLQGPAVELLLGASASIGSPVKRDDILILPWARGYRNAQQGPNSVLFSTIRTPQRENSFQWVGPIASESDVLIALKERHITITNPIDMKNYITGAVRGDVGEEILNDLGVPMQSIASLSQVSSLAKMLKAERIDLWIFGDDGWREALVSNDIDPTDFEVIYRFTAKKYYYALSLDIDPQLVQTFQQAINSKLEQVSIQASK